MSNLKQLLASEIGVSEEDFSDVHLDVLITIGKGMFWDEPFDKQARELACEIEAEFSSQALLEGPQEAERPETHARHGSDKG